MPSVRPECPGTKSRRPIRFHKAMAWIHGPGKILTPILGAMAYSQKKQWGKGAWDRHTAWAGSLRDGWGVWGGPLFVGIA